jgi:hypothetical protein
VRFLRSSSLPLQSAAKDERAEAEIDLYKVVRSHINNVLSSFAEDPDRVAEVELEDLRVPACERGVFDPSHLHAEATPLDAPCAFLGQALFRCDVSAFFEDGAFHKEHHKGEQDPDHGKDQEGALDRTSWLNANCAG